MHTMETPPESFHEQAFEDCLRLISKQFTKDNDTERFFSMLRQLVMVAGGQDMADALNTDGFPPCVPQDNCSTCWLYAYCQYSDLPPVMRRLIHALRREASTYVNDLPPDIKEKLITTSKIEPGPVVALARKLEEGLGIAFVSEAIKPSDGDSTEDLEWVYTAGILANLEEPEDADLYSVVQPGPDCEDDGDSSASDPVSQETNNDS